MFQALHLRLRSNSNLHSERVNNDETITNGRREAGEGERCGMKILCTSKLSCQLQTFFPPSKISGGFHLTNDANKSNGPELVDNVQPIPPIPLTSNFSMKVLLFFFFLFSSECI